MELAKLNIEWGDTPTLARCGGVAVGSTLPSYTYKRDGGYVKFLGGGLLNVLCGTSYLSN
jgi:hypothetical protein